MKKKLLAGLAAVTLLVGVCGGSDAFKDGMQDALNDTQEQSVLAPETESEMPNTLAKSNLGSPKESTGSTQDSEMPSTEINLETETEEPTEYAFEQKAKKSTEVASQTNTKKVQETELPSNSTKQSTSTDASPAQQSTQPETPQPSSSQQTSEVPQSSAPVQDSNQTQSEGTVQESTPSATSNTQPTEEMVWIPATGSKYHKNSSCSNMKNPSQVSKDEAINRGYEPCKKCY